MISIAYVSAATSELSDEDIAEILVQARANNVRLDLTGMLLYRRGRFIQILEGPDHVVLDRFSRISADSRHRNVQLMTQQPIVTRQFPEWTMGFRPISDESAKRLVGFEDFFGRSGKVRLEHAENPAQQFLEWLGEYWFPKS